MYVGVDGETTDLKDKPTYATVAKKNSDIEEKIGLSLAKNGEVPKLAKAIMTFSEVPIHQGKVDPSKIGQFGGAKSANEGWDTLGSSIFNTMEVIESADNKPKYSTSTTVDHPYFKDGLKKKDFDKDLSACKWKDLPSDAWRALPSIENLYNSWTQFQRREELRNYRHSSSAAQGTANMLIDAFKGDSLGEKLDQLQLPNLDEQSKKQQKEYLKAEIIQMKNDPNSGDDLKAKLGALLDIVVDEHTSGDHTNMVKRNQNPGNLNETPWIDDTVAAGKPIISGPSGHTLRYLNFWAEKRKKQMGDSSAETRNMTDWPSLEAARLVMMADLMPPKHHSYDEIMTSSIGITDKASTPLMYNHKSSYLDLATQKESDAKEVARKAYKDSGAYSVETNLDLDAKLSMRNADVQIAELPQVVDQDSLKKQTGLVESAISALRSLSSSLSPDDAAKAGIETAIGALRRKLPLEPTSTTPSAPE